MVNTSDGNFVVATIYIVAINTLHKQSTTLYVIIMKETTKGKVTMITVTTAILFPNFTLTN